jgi:hypothetical protein
MPYPAALVASRTHPKPVNAAIAAKRKTAKANWNENDSTAYSTARNFGESMPSDPRILAPRARHCTGVATFIDEFGPFCHWSYVMKNLWSLNQELLLHFNPRIRLFDVKAQKIQKNHTNCTIQLLPY